MNTKDNLIGEIDDRLKPGDERFENKKYLYNE